MCVLVVELWDQTTEFKFQIATYKLCIYVILEILPNFFMPWIQCLQNTNNAVSQGCYEDWMKNTYKQHSILYILSKN